MPPFDLASITTNEKPQPARILVYGSHGVGKTTFAASAPHPIIVRTEDGLGILKTPAFPLASDYMQVMDALRTLYKEQHTYRTVIVDSLDWLEPLVWARTCLEHGKENIEDWGYSKGYTYAEEYWSGFLNALNHLRAKGMTVILIAHSEIKTFNAPDTEPYDRYQPALHKGASSMAQEWADVVGFAHYEVFTQKTETGFNKKVVRGTGTGNRILSLEERPAFLAKNKYSLPAEIPLEWSAFAGALRAAYTAAPPSNGATPAIEPTTTQPTEELINA